MYGLTLPFINRFSVLTQLFILATLIIISYLYKGVRYVLFGLIITYFGFKIVVPVCRWAYYLFKGVALFGFYVHYFQIGIGFIVTGFGLLSQLGDGLSILSTELDKMNLRPRASTGSAGGDPESEEQ